MWARARPLHIPPILTAPTHYEPQDGGRDGRADSQTGHLNSMAIEGLKKFRKKVEEREKVESGEPGSWVSEVDGSQSRPWEISGKGIHWLGRPREAVQWPAPGFCFDCIGVVASRGKAYKRCLLACLPACLPGREGVSRCCRSKA
ncbi:hypothetical protein Pmani_039353 [Petrolisthes manimaculis]|uniref:Uncharacterized protein n=1 Tax=Petrolisthes manimaculis TaxID=1843537 RepID=A0AAE1NEB1_9EUCA|nr:hypothetical protein Pmani_039353 [Petrolisthes manimaculis]